MNFANQSRSIVQQNQSKCVIITFDTQLKTALSFLMFDQKAQRIFKIYVNTSPSLHQVLPVPDLVLANCSKLVKMAIIWVKDTAEQQFDVRTPSVILNNIVILLT